MLAALASKVIQEMEEIDIEKSKNLVSALISKVASNPEELDNDDVINVMKFLWQQTNILFDRVRSWEEGSRNGKDYFDGVELGKLAKELAGVFDGRNDEMCELSHRIRLKAILQVQPHYHHIIGPSMLSHSEVLERLGRKKEAQDNYNCIISDFLWLVEDYTENIESPNEEDFISLSSLLLALEHVCSKEGTKNHESLIIQTKEILARRENA